MNARPLSDIVRLDQLLDAYFEYFRGEIAAGRRRPRTLESYEHLLRQWAGKQSPDCLIADLRRFHLTGKGGATRHRIVAVKQLFKWADDEQITEGNPFSKVKAPKTGRRKRVLTRPQSASLLRACDPRTTKQRNFGFRGKHSPQRPLRMVFFAMARTLARPQEIRDLQWEDFDDEKRQLMLGKFKGQNRRSDQLRCRIVPVTNPSLLRLLRTWKARRNPSPKDFIFLTHRGFPWSTNALCLAVRRARSRAGLDDGGEPIVAYTQRHTAVTKAFKNGATASQIATVVGHSKPTMTEWYNHMESSEMASVVEAAMRREPRREKAKV